jgi:hypothetical protein
VLQQRRPRFWFLRVRWLTARPPLLLSWVVRLRSQLSDEVKNGAGIRQTLVVST